MTRRAVVGGDDRRRTSTVGVVAAALVLVVVAVACRPLPMGGPTYGIGNDVATGCPQFQPSPAPGCGPQPMLWASTQGPYESFANGDPYATKCARGGVVSPAACSSGPFAGGATNELYDPTGYEYAIDVGPADVGRSMQLQVWDAGSFQRTTTPATKAVTGSRTAGSNTIVRNGGANLSSADVGRSVTGTGIPAGATIMQYTSPSQFRISVNAISTGSGTLTISSPADCTSTSAPFDSAPYDGAISAATCQTGDAGSAPFQLQLFENDGFDNSISYDQPIPACELYVPAGSSPVGLKNAWATVCTLTPTQAGTYPLRVKTSNIVRPSGTAVADTGAGFNNYALRVQGSTVTRLNGLDALSIYANTPAATTRFYLAEVTAADAGKRLQIDVFDPGDGTSGESSVQILGPPAGAPSRVPTTGAMVPASGLADSCRYNPVVSPTRGPEVAEPAGVPAADCTVATRSGGGNHYESGWLSIEIGIAEDYACTTDCWWTVRYATSGGSGVPADRMVWSTLLLD